MPSPNRLAEEDRTPATQDTGGDADSTGAQTLGIDNESVVELAQPLLVEDTW